MRKTDKTGEKWWENGETIEKNDGKWWQIKIDGN